MRARILVVEDTPFSRDLLVQEIEEQGYQVLEAEDGVAAIEVMSEHTPDLVVLDIEMPRMDGLQVLTWIRERFSQAELPVVMATARIDSVDVVRALEIGANDYVGKPVDVPVLLARIKRLLENATHRGEAAAALRKLDLPRQPITEPEHDEEDDLVGEVLAGRYRLDKRLGEGASGSVYRARDSDLGRFFAVKLIDISSSRDAVDEDAAREALRTEVLTMARLRNPHIVQVYELLHVKDSTFAIVMDWVEGTSLRELLDTRRLAVDEAVEIAQQVAVGLHALHEAEVVHHDLQPGNVMITELAGGTLFAQILDFGVARQSGGAERVFRGSVQYAAPEQLMGQPVDPRADVYALGCLLHHMITGVAPFDRLEVEDVVRRQVSQRLPTIAPEVLGSTYAFVSALLSEMTEKVPARRLSSAEGVVERIRAGRSGTPASAIDDGATVPIPDERVERPAGRSAALAFWTGLAAAVAGGAIWVSMKLLM